MKCPSCQWAQSDDRLDCEGCGLIFAKWRERHAPPQAETSAPPGENPEAAPAVGVEVLLQEAGIPDRPEEESLPLGQRPRLYEQIAALDFQKDLDGHWIYFPWGVFWKGYRLNDSDLKDRIEDFLIRFCTVHSPMAALLGLSALVTWIYNPEDPYRGSIFLGSYLILAYLFLGIKIAQWVSKLTPSANKMNQSQYYYLFFKIFYWRTLLDLEVISLLMLLAGLWFWLSDKWLWFIAVENISILWMCLAFSGAIHVLFSYLYYFRKK